MPISLHPPSAEIPFWESTAARDEIILHSHLTVIPVHSMSMLYTQGHMHAHTQIPLSIGTDHVLSNSLGKLWMLNYLSRVSTQSNRFPTPVALTLLCGFPVDSHHEDVATRAWFPMPLTWTLLGGFPPHGRRPKQPSSRCQQC